MCSYVIMAQETIQVKTTWNNIIAQLKKLSSQPWYVNMHTFLKK